MQQEQEQQEQQYILELEQASTRHVQYRYWVGKGWRLYSHGIGGSDALMKARIRLEVKWE
jgi:hypothetical protein